MPDDLELALRVRADMREALHGLGRLNRTLGETERRGGAAGAALDGAAGATRALAGALGALGRESQDTLDRARDAAEGTFHAMEQSLVAFVRTGKFSVRSLVDSIVTDLARLAARRVITEPLTDALFSVLPGLFGGGQAPGGAPLFGRLRAGVAHAGRIAGAPGGVSRAVPPTLFVGASRHHSGGIVGLRPDEVPIIAQAGETILPRGAAIVSPAVTISFHNQGTPQREVRREVRLDPRGLIVEVVTDDLRRGGPIHQTMARELRGGLP